MTGYERGDETPQCEYSPMEDGQESGHEDGHENREQIVVKKEPSTIKIKQEPGTPAPGSTAPATEQDGNLSPPYSEFQAGFLTHIHMSTLVGGYKCGQLVANQAMSLLVLDPRARMSPESEEWKAMVVV